MSDHEPSYYEIALTNRQVVVAFVILLGCLLGSFFAGVWIGRGEASPVVVTSGQARADSDSIEELPFFAGGELGTDDEEPEAAGEAAPPPSVPEPAAARAQRQARQGAERPAPPPEEDELAGGEGAALGSDAPAGPPPAVRTPPATAPQRAAEAPAQAPAVSGPVIQVFVSRDRGQAERVLERLRGGGERAFLSPVEVEGQSLYRIRLGPFGDRPEAERVAERVRRAYRLETWITQ